MSDQQCAEMRCHRPAHTMGLCTLHYQRFRKGEIKAGRWEPDERYRESLPNPWVDEAPLCPHCGEAAYFWAGGPLCWFCPPCRHRFDIAVEAVA